MAFFIFVIANAISPIIYSILLGFYFDKKKDHLKPEYRFSLVFLYSAMLGSYMLLADALRRLYKNLKDYSDVKLNKTLMCAYFASTIFYFVCIVVLLVLTILSKYEYYSTKALIGQLLSNLSGYCMDAILIVLYWEILKNLPTNTTDEREEALK